MSNGSAAFSRTIAKTSTKRFIALSSGPEASSGANRSRNAKYSTLPRIFQCALPGVTLQRELNQTVQELRIGQARVFPHFRVHADGRKTRNCVYFIHKK